MLFVQTKEYNSKVENPLIVKGETYKLQNETLQVPNFQLLLIESTKH